MLNVAMCSKVAITLILPFQKKITYIGTNMDHDDVTRETSMKNFKNKLLQEENENLFFTCFNH